MGQKSKFKFGERQKTINQILESTQEIWLAGLAAFEQAQQEGSKFFESLVKKGRKVEERVRDNTEDQAEEMRAKASGAWDKLEKAFEERVQRALTRLSVPDKTTIDELKLRVELLEQQLSELTRATTAPAPTKPPPETESIPADAPSSTPAADIGSGGDATEIPPAPAERPGDNLQVINGLGPAMERKLKAFGITTYRQLTALTDVEIERLEQDILRSRGRIAREDWIGQAREAHLRQYGEQL